MNGTVEYAYGAALKRVRQAAGIRQWQLAQRLGPGWHQSRISKIEKGKVRLFTDEFLEIVEAFPPAFRSKVFEELEGCEKVA